jgi:hypothetical protein
MRLVSPLLSLSLLHSVGSVSARWEAGLDGDLYGEIPNPTPAPLLDQDRFKHGSILMETSLGHRRNETSRRDLALGARAVCGLLGHMGNPDVAIRLPAQILATFSHVPLQSICPVAPRSTLCVDLLPEQNHRSTLFCRSAAMTLQIRAVVLATSASVLRLAVAVA